MKSNNQTKSKKRLNYLDIARGIAIILMLIFHFIPHNFIRNYVYSFHMPLFIIVSGYFYKDEKLTTLIKKTFKNLLLPYIICITIVYIIKPTISETFNLKYLISYILLANSNAKLSNIEYVGILWFIPFLIAIKFIFWFLKTHLKSNKELLFITTILCCLLGFILSYNKLYLPWSIDAALTCTLFYYTGYLLHKYNILEYMFKNQQMFLYALLLYFITFLFGNIEIATRIYPYGFICLFTAILGSLVIFFISKKIEDKTNHLSKTLTWFGKNSIYILLFHYAEANLLNYNTLNLNPIMIAIIRITLITILVLIYLKLKKKITYKKLSLQK